MAFTDTFKKNSLIKETENGGRAFSSTNGGVLLDLFSTIGGKRRASAEEIEKICYRNVLRVYEAVLK